MNFIKRMGSLVNEKQKRVLCMNKVDLVEKKKDLLKVAEEFKDLPGYERYYFPQLFDNQLWMPDIVFDYMIPPSF